MGYSAYSVSSRAIRANSAGYYTKSRDEVFEQSKYHSVHALMMPKGIKLREACDSKEHPNTTPIQLYLDVTGSMGYIPHEMIKDGLPKLVGTLIQNGIADVSLMFGAIGDHECDRGPLQIGQFESGDAEMDMWLKRVWLEQGGGANMGESYLLAWYFAGYHTRIDSFDKRNQKGFVFTIGDEPCLLNLPVSAVKEIMGDTAVGQGNYTREELLTKAQAHNHVYHIHVNHEGRNCHDTWKQILGQNLIEVYDYKQISQTLSNIILSHQVNGIIAPVTKLTESEQEPKITL